MSIGEFARQSRLSANALRLYDELGLLRPARVDSDSGYRYYEASQLEQARLVAALRQLQIPLAGIKAMLGLEPPAAAERIGEYWAAAEAEHSARRDLAGYLVNHLSGKRPAMEEVTTRDIPSRSLLCLKRAVDGQPGAWTLGKEFVALLRARPLPCMEGRAGAAFCIYWGEVSEDRDAPSSGAGPFPMTGPRYSPPSSPNCHCAPSQRTVRHSSISAPEDRSAPPSGRWPHSRSTPGQTSTVHSQASWASG
jgi:DNA-binding transcriptional MerR regulator